MTPTPQEHEQTISTTIGEICSHCGKYVADPIPTLREEEEEIGWRENLEKYGPPHPTKPTWEKTISEKINHSWDGQFYAMNNNSMAYVDVTDEVSDLLTQREKEAEEQGRNEILKEVGILRQLVAETNMTREQIYEELDKIAPLDPDGVIPKIVASITPPKG